MGTARERSFGGAVANVCAGGCVVSRDVGCWMVSESRDQSPGVVQVHLKPESTGSVEQWPADTKLSVLAKLVQILMLRKLS